MKTAIIRTGRTNKEHNMKLIEKKTIKSSPKKARLEITYTLNSGVTKKVHVVKL